MPGPRQPPHAAARTFPDELAQGIRYATWRSRIQMASDLDRLSETVRDYFAGWRYDELRGLPPDITVLAVNGAADLAASAVVATRIELKFEGDERTGRLLREMALTLRAAASRFRFLTALRAREGEGVETTTGTQIEVTEDEIASWRREYPRVSRIEVLWTLARHGPARSEIERVLEDIARGKA